MKQEKRRTLLRLLKNFGYHKTLSLLALLFAGATSLVTIIKPYLLKLVIDENLKIGLRDIRKIGGIALIYFMVVFAGLACDYLQALTLGSLGQRIMHRLRTKLFSHIQSMNMKFFDSN